MEDKDSLLHVYVAAGSIIANTCVTKNESVVDGMEDRDSLLHVYVAAGSIIANSCVPDEQQFPKRVQSVVAIRDWTLFRCFSVKPRLPPFIVATDLQ